MVQSSSSDSDLKRVMTRLRFVARWKRSFRKRFNYLLHGESYFITEYFGACFLVRLTEFVWREISFKNFEQIQIQYFIDTCARFRPELFIDIGAYGGLYSCVLLRQDLVQRAILFEPDQRNVVHLRTNLLINDLLERAEIYEIALGREAGRARLVPGARINTGMSRLVADSKNGDGYDVNLARLDDILQLSNMRLAIKIDVEGSELKVLEGMAQTLRNNRGVVQIETVDARKEVIDMMKDLGYALVADFYRDLVFERPDAIDVAIMIPKQPKPY